jgi:hypothetical protein
VSTDDVYKNINYMKTFIHYFVKTFPNIILNRSHKNDVELPRYWELSLNHYRLIKTNIANYYEPLTNIKGMDAQLRSIQQNLDKIINLSLITPTMTNAENENERVYTIFDKQFSLSLFKYYILLIFTEYINMATTFSPLILNQIENEALRRELMANTKTLIISYLQIMFNSKQNIDIDYGKIMDGVFKERETEKNKIVEKLTLMTQEMRDVDTMLKKNKLGDWGKGLSKNVRKYNSTAYDMERKDQDRDQYDGGDDEIEAGEMESIDELNEEAFIDEDADMMGNLPEDDGDYYHEDDAEDYPE